MPAASERPAPSRSSGTIARADTTPTNPVASGTETASSEVASVASFVVPAALAIVCAGNGMGFYDSPELASAAAGLGTTHPPGHPLFVCLGAAATLVPVGSLAFRVALLSGLLLGIVGRLTFAATLALARDLGDGRVSARVVNAASFAASLCATCGPATFRQATRPEVYALAAVLAAIIIVLALSTTDASMRIRVGALVLGLGAANHHFIALTVSPLLVVMFVARVRGAPSSRGRIALRSIAAAAPLFALGLVPYALLPLRADALASLPRVHTFSEWLDTASARVFARNTGSAVPGSAGGRFADVLDWFGQTLTPFGLLCALGGAYLALRSARTRRRTFALWAIVVVVTGARAWLGFVRDNPDAAGYLVPAVVPLAVMVGLFAVGSRRALLEAPEPPKGPSPAARFVLGIILVAGPILLPGFLGVTSVQASAVDRTYVPETLASSALAALPPRTILFAYEPHTVFRLRYAMLVEGERPDVTVVPEPLLGYPGMVNWLLSRDRALAPLMTQWMLRPERGMQARWLSSLAVDRIVAVEIDPRNVREQYGVLLPRGPIAQVMSEPTTLASVRGASAAHFNRMDQLGNLLDREIGARTLVDEAMVWRAYNEALFFAARGARPEARRSIARGLDRAPNARELNTLRDALAQPGDGPIDIAPFLPGTP